MTRTRTTETTQAEHISSFIKENELSVRELGKLLHIHPNTISSYLRANQAPAWTLVAIEGLKRRQRASEPTLIVVKCPSNKLQAITSVLSSMDIPFKAV